MLINREIHVMVKVSTKFCLDSSIFIEKNQRCKVDDNS